MATMNKFLHEMGLLWKVNRQWVLGGKWTNRPYHKVRQNIRSNAYGELIAHPDSLWTAKGQLAVSRLLTSMGHDPVSDDEEALITIEKR